MLFSVSSPRRSETKPDEPGRFDGVKDWFVRVGDAAERGRDRARTQVSRLPGGLLTWKILIGVLGLAIIVLGVILLPLPGPGWLIIFLGLGLWGTEFEWAKRLLGFARRQVGAWTDWVQRQPRWMQALVGLVGLIFLAAVLYGTYWLYTNYLS